MCGLAGFLGNRLIDSSNLKRLESCIEHRGPDASVSKKIKVSEGYNLYLFFTRLAIIDLDDRAMQPFRFGQLTILLNGEIYNYRSLRRRIEVDFGEQFWKTSGDVEIALRYISLYGIESIKDFDGMFALAIWDESKKELMLARDFFGEKPLFYCLDQYGLSFASEPKCFVHLTSNVPRFNLSKISNFIVNGYKSLYKDTFDFYQKIERVQPGEILSFTLMDLQNPKSIIYKRLPSSRVIKQESRPDAVNRIRKAVIESVGLRLESDVPIAISLSGGIDSGLIAAIAKKDFGVSLHAYTLESKDPRYSESKNAKAVAEYLDLPHTIIEIPEDKFLDRMRDLVYFHDSPVSTISYYIQSFLLEKMNQDGFKVALMGTGADEIFTGYYDHHLLYLAELSKINSELYNSALEFWQENVLPLVRNPNYQDPSLYLANPLYRDHIFDCAPYAGELLLDNIATDFSEKRYVDSNLRNRMLNELFEEVVPVILKEDDRNSMRYSIENRSPFLSYEVLLQSLKTDNRHLINLGRTKSLLRDAFCDYLPNDIISSYRKVGFNANFWEICEVGSLEFKEFLEDDSFFWSLLDFEKVREILREENRKNDIKSKIAFNITSAKIFLDAQIKYNH